MLEFLIGYWLGSSGNRSECETRYFRETPPRKRTQEEIRKSLIKVIIIATFVAITLLVYLDLLYRTIPVMRFL